MFCKSRYVNRFYKAKVIGKLAGKGYLRMLCVLPDVLLVGCDDAVDRIPA